MSFKDKQFKTMGLKKTIKALTNWPKELRTVADVREFRNKTDNCGQGTEDKIIEVMQTGVLQRVVNASPEELARQLFCTIWGVGNQMALRLVASGFRTLDGLRADPGRAALTRTQQVGLEHYADIAAKIPRKEVAAIEQLMQAACDRVWKGLVAVATGSYRRGKATCGDVDVTISHPHAILDAGKEGFVLERASGKIKEVFTALLQELGKEAPGGGGKFLAHHLCASYGLVRQKQCMTT